jgi:hypothetical protein
MQSEHEGMKVRINKRRKDNTAWRVLGLRMEKQLPAMESSCEYIE